ncbi:hypothetical protein B0H13DRAFT_146003 [Mycena leptocephala]|nr:hypothetical protein B0H13DRAFT_146003 [Mycena leptocephala]
MAARARVKYLAAMTVVRKNGVYVGGAGARFFFFFFPTATPIQIACGFLSSYHYRSCPFHVPPGDPYFGERALMPLYLSFSSSIQTSGGNFERRTPYRNPRPSRPCNAIRRLRRAPFALMFLTDDGDIADSGKGGAGESDGAKMKARNPGVFRVFFNMSLRNLRGSVFSFFFLVFLTLHFIPYFLSIPASQAEDKAVQRR